MKPKYEIGQEIFWGNFTAYKQEYVTCPDCGGTGRVRVTFHDETTVSIPCTTCASSYSDPTGRIMVYCRKADARSGKISGIDIRDNKIEYKVLYHNWGADDCCSSSYVIDEKDVFLSKEEAEARSEQMAIEYDAEEREKLFKKEKPTKTWAWNASYHRREIKELERRIEYHTKKLSHANLMKKEPKT